MGALITAEVLADAYLKPLLPFPWLLEMPGIRVPQEEIKETVTWKKSMEMPLRAHQPVPGQGSQGLYVTGIPS